MENNKEEESLETQPAVQPFPPVLEKKEPEHKPKLDEVTKQVKKKVSEVINGVVFWSGTIAACITSIAYFAIIIVMVTGINVETDLMQNLIFAIISGAVGLILAAFLKIQGQSFARYEYKSIFEAYRKKPQPKPKKYKSMSYFWVKSTITDTIFKMGSIILINCGTIYIFIRASADPMLILLAIFNFLMFLSFGVIALAKAYNFTINEEVNRMVYEMEQEKIMHEEEKKKAQELKEKLEAEEKAHLEKPKRVYKKREEKVKKQVKQKESEIVEKNKGEKEIE